MSNATNKVLAGEIVAVDLWHDGTSENNGWIVDTVDRDGNSMTDSVYNWYDEAREHAIKLAKQLGVVTCGC